MPGIARGAFAIVHAVAYPMTSPGARIDDATLVVRGGRIVAFGRSLPVPRDATVVDARGHWLIPGLIDAHMHCVDDPEIDFRLDLRRGITTVFNLAGGVYHVDWRARLARGTMFGPSLLTTGPQMDGVPPEGSERAIVTAPLAAEASVADQKRTGYDAIKVYSGLDLATYDAIMDAARRFGFHVTGHLPPKVGLAHAMARHQAIAHAEELLYAYDFRDDASVERAVKLVADAHVPLTGTLVAYETIAKQVATLDGLRDAPSMRYVDARVRAAWTRENGNYRARFAPDRAPRLARLLAFQQQLVGKLDAAGVPIFVGTDASTEVSGIPFDVPGFAYVREIELLRAAGLTPAHVLTAATVAVPRWLGRTAEFGTLAPGSRADALLVDRDPLADSGALTDPSLVVVRGVAYTRDELQREVDDIPAMLARETDFIAAVRRDGAVPAIVALEAARSADPAHVRIRQAALDTLAGSVLEKNVPDGLALAALETRLFRDSADAWDTLGAAYRRSGDLARARAAYRLAVAMNPALDSSQEALDQLGR
jgi:imidazolonepropionase-like amidohydrolase